MNKNQARKRKYTQARMIKLLESGNWAKANAYYMNMTGDNSFTKVFDFQDMERTCIKEHRFMTNEEFEKRELELFGRDGLSGIVMPLIKAINNIDYSKI